MLNFLEQLDFYFAVRRLDMKKKQKEERNFAISVEIGCSDGSNLRKSEPDKPYTTINETKGKAIIALAAFTGAFIGAFLKGIKEEAVKKEKGSVEKIKFTLSDKKGVVEERTVEKEEMEKIVKK